MQSAERIAFRRATLESRSFCWNAGMFLALHVADVSRLTSHVSDFRLGSAQRSRCSTFEQMISDGHAKSRPAGRSILKKSQIVKFTWMVSVFCVLVAFPIVCSLQLTVDS